MVLFNYGTRELVAKIVFYGPGLCGKTTNLEHIHKNLPDKTRGKMLSLATQTDRTLFFDFLPLDLGSVKGMKTRVQLYTVPGQVFYDATRKLVLKGADGVVFVVDSQKELMESNLESWENLKDNLRENNLDIENIPLVIQYNKRDLPNVLPIRELDKKINEVKAPYFEAIAINGQGVQDTLKGITKVVLNAISRKYMREERVMKEEKTPLPGQRQDEILKTALTGQHQEDPEVARPPQRPEVREEVKELPGGFELVAKPETARESVEIEELESLEELVDFQLPGTPESTFPSKPAPVTSAAKGGVNETLKVDLSSLESALSEQKYVPPANLVGPPPPSEEEEEPLQEVRIKAVHPPAVSPAPARSAPAASVAAPQIETLPTEITVSQEGDLVRVQISINLKIRLLPK
jgi:mutual gliding-motility protein MglA